jgi:predicted  nucleic acid-binding Zn ribbon protein
MELEDNIRKLRESLTVTSAQVLRHEDAIKDHEEWLRSHELAMSKAAARHDKEMAEIRAEARERGEVLDKRIERLVSGIGKFLREQH